MEKKEESSEISFTMSNGDRCSVKVRRGRNRNINVSVENPEMGRTLGDLNNPFSIFSPGLAGVARSENYVSDGVLMRALARGDANLVLRNILLRLSNTESWVGFKGDIHEVFPKAELEVAFDEKTDENIAVQLQLSQHRIPIDLAGTGLLQAIQILSYIHLFSPRLIVLDEPDSHLHPNNQRLLCALLQRIAADRGVQVILTTHSRHVVDALGGASAMLWVRDGKASPADQDDDLGILMEIGALDVRERLQAGAAKAFVLTEDELLNPLRCLLASSGFEMDETDILPYFGFTSIKNLRALVRVMRKDTSSRVIVHRDRDYLSDEQVAGWEKEVRELGALPMVTEGTDIESHLVNPVHLSGQNDLLSEADASELIKSAIADASDELTARYVNGMIDVARKNGQSTDPGKLAVAAVNAVNSEPRWRHGKLMVKALRRVWRQQHSTNLSIFKPSDAAGSVYLRDLAKSIFT